MNPEPLPDWQQAIAADDLGRLDAILSTDPAARESLVQAAHSNPRLLAGAGSVPMAHRLLDLGCPLEPVSRWWASGIGVQSHVRPDVGRFLIARGAHVTPHLCAALGLVDRLTDLLDDDPSVVDAPGGDDCTPLHFARDIATADLLLSRGARIDARDSDHDSTPAEWLIGPAPEVARHLVDRGASASLCLAAALGDQALADRLIAADRTVLGGWIGKPPLHSLGHAGRGGTILQWTLGFNSFPHQIAARRGHAALARHLWDESDPTTQFLVACVTADRPAALALRAAHPGIVENLAGIDRELLARYCWETNADLDAVRLMLDCSFPVDHPETAHLYSPLHNAAWGGYAELVELLLERGHPVNVRDPQYQGTPLSAAIYCAVVDGRHPEGEYARVIAALLNAGATWDTGRYPTGHPGIDAELLRHLATDGPAGSASRGGN